MSVALVGFNAVVQGFAHDIAGDDTALATLAGHAQGSVHFAHGAGAILDSGANLGVGYALAETDVHVVFAS